MVVEYKNDRLYYNNIQYKEINRQQFIRILYIINHKIHY